MNNDVAAANDDSSDVTVGRSPLDPADYIAATAALYGGLGYEPYRWAHNAEPQDLVPLTKSLSDMKVMLVGSGGIYRHGQIAFHTKDDTSIRLIPSDTPSSDLRTAHFAYDQTDARADPNCVFPLERLTEMVSNGEIGSLTKDAVGFMGGIYSTRRLMEETAEHLLGQCRAAEPDLVLLVPV